MSTPDDRRLQLRGLFNARDLGGLPTSDGGVIAGHRLYRAEVLTYPGSAGIHAVWDKTDAAALSELGVRTVIDLRGVEEARATPSAWGEATGARTVRGCPIDDGGHGAARDYVDMLLTRRMDAFFAEDLGGHYITVIEARAHTFGQAVTAIAEGVPALVHCTEGKDRTGLLVALVMSAAGVLADPIVEDYALTGQWRPDRALAYASHFEAAGVPLESFRVLYESPAVAMRMALDHLRAEYGTVTNYLTSRAGVTEDAIQRLRACLVAGSSRDQADRETI